MTAHDFVDRYRDELDALSQTTVIICTPEITITVSLESDLDSEYELSTDLDEHYITSTSDCKFLQAICSSAMYTNHWLEELRPMIMKIITPSLIQKDKAIRDQLKTAARLADLEWDKIRVTYIYYAYTHE